MKINQGEHISVVGSTGTGKTYWLVNALAPAFGRVLYIDSTDDDLRAFPAVSVKKALALAKGEGSFVVRVIFNLNPVSLEPLWTGLLKMGHDMAVVIDEVTDLSTPSRIPPALLQLIRKARHRKISVVVSTQRPQGLNKWFLGNSQHRVWAYMSDFDRNAIGDYAPWAKERMAEIPYRSFKTLYQAPDGTLHPMPPAEKYDWEPRLKAQRRGRK